MRKILFLGLALSLLVNKTVWAAGFNLKSIGGVTTNNQQLSHWWNTASSPTLIGEANPSEDVVIDIDGTQVQVSADSAGEWVYTPTSVLSDGDHVVTITNSTSSTISFTLTTGTGNVDWDAVAAGGSATLPTVGVVLPTLIFLVTGSGLVWGGKKLIE